MVAALFAVLLLIAIYMPVIRIIALFFLPLPFAVYVIRNGFKAAIVVWLAAVVISLLITGFLGPLYVLLFGVGGLVTGWLYKQRRPAFHILLGGSLAYTGATIAIFLIAVTFLHVNIIDQYIHFLNMSIDNAANMGASLGMDNKDQLNALKQQIDQARYLAPFLFVFVGITFALVTQLVNAPILRRIGLGAYVTPWVPFRDWRFPKSFLWYYLAVLIVGLFQSFSPGSVWFSFYINLFVILQCIVLLQGITFIFFYFYMRNAHKSIPILVVVGSLLITPLLPVSALIRILGVLDIGFDLRTRLQAK